MLLKCTYTMFVLKIFYHHATVDKKIFDNREMLFIKMEAAFVHLSLQAPFAKFILI